MPRRNLWDGELDEVLADFSQQKSEIEIARQLMETVKNGGKVPLDVLDDVIERLDARHNNAANSLRQLKVKLK